MTVVSVGTGISFSFMKNRAGLDLGSNYAVTVFFDPSTKHVSNIVQESSTGVSSFWLSDINGDGVPDMRREMGQESREIFIGGEWIRASHIGSNWTILQNAKTNSVRFDKESGKWRVSDQR